MIVPWRRCRSLVGAVVATDRADQPPVARKEGLRATGSPEVPFLCVRKAGRSQMAAARLHELSGDRVDVRSAGSMPGGGLNPVVTHAMAEFGIDLVETFPKPLTYNVVRASDVIVTMGCRDACPVYPGKRYLDWALPDPAVPALAQVRSIRERVVGLLAELLPDGVEPH